MKQIRDVYQRKIYALLRMNLAMTRMNKSIDEGERAKAVFWVNAWLAASGIRRFKLVRKVVVQVDNESKKRAVDRPVH